MIDTYILKDIPQKYILPLCPTESMKLYQVLEHQLKKEPDFVSEAGELKKWVVLDKAQNFDETLIALLLQNEDLKKEFFLPTWKI